MATIINQEESVDSDRLNDFIKVKCNWEIKTGKRIRDTVSTIRTTQAPERMVLDNVVSLETCVALFSNNAEAEPCMIDIKLTNNQRIQRIAVVSEATVLEFFKQCGEYSSTEFAEFIDEFEDQSVYIGEATLNDPTPEASIKFAKRKRQNPEMWLYGIKLILTDAKEEKSSGMFNFDVINGLLTNSKLMNTDKALAAKKVLNSFSLQDKDLGFPNFEACVGKLMLHSEPSSRKQEQRLEIDNSEAGDQKEDKEQELREYIDHKFEAMEQRLATKLEDMETRINGKLETILAIVNK